MVVGSAQVAYFQASRWGVACGCRRTKTGETDADGRIYGDEWESHGGKDKDMPGEVSFVSVSVPTSYFSSSVCIHTALYLVVVRTLPRMDLRCHHLDRDYGTRGT